MAKKGGKSKGVVSKGERSSVSKKLLNAMRQDRRANPSIESEMQRRKDRAAARGDLRKKHDKEDSEMRVAQDLFARYEGVATWAACVQAAKTDHVSQFHSKYGSRLSQSKG